MRSLTSFAVTAFLVAAIPFTAASGHGDNMRLRYEACSPSQDGSCSGCGADYVPCGSDTCYNPKAGETCCSSDYACPSGFNCSTTGSKCLSADGKRHASFRCRYGEDDTDDDDDDGMYNTTSSILSTTTTITSTTTNTVTVSASTTSCALTGSTTGLPLTSSVASYGNTTTIALNTTTSTLSVANATGASPTANVTFNATKGPSPTISPPINGYKGAAAGLQGRSSVSLFALGSLIFMSALLL
ncbi:hypothetical protein PV08_04390 [Exophiala spinifera]|uniref:GPI anchored protein n=1 Tax=Exophiala spinifera TaxID=91928 RepID=A0A0D2C0L1_9EURO|nr:uncharacterized protein PV08_04390 [Exophiala spinifera]KIW17199.1 hypothetical protein PV08_04390 [Exophiala spinifera]